MKKIVSLILVFFVFLSFISATSALDLFPLYTTEQKASLISGEMIKEICIPIQVDRLGNIIAINND